MFWDNVAGIYDLFADFFNGRVHEVLCREVADLILADDDVLECACGTGMLTVHIAPRCHKMVATDFSHKMLQRAATKCRKFSNATFEFADILHLDYPDALFSKVVAANVIHLLDEPMKALAELDRVCKPGGQIIIPTYINIYSGKLSFLTRLLGKAGAKFKHQFDIESYQEFFRLAGYEDATFHVVEGRMPCAIAVIKK